MEVKPFWADWSAKAHADFIKALDERVASDPKAREAFARWQAAYDELAGFIAREPRKFLVVPDDDAQR